MKRSRGTPPRDGRRCGIAFNALGLLPFRGPGAGWKARHGARPRLRQVSCFSTEGVSRARTLLAHAAGSERRLHGFAPPHTARRCARSPWWTAAVRRGSAVPPGSLERQPKMLCGRLQAPCCAGANRGASGRCAHPHVARGDASVESAASTCLSASSQSSKSLPPANPRRSAR